MPSDNAEVLLGLLKAESEHAAKTTSLSALQVRVVSQILKLIEYPVPVSVLRKQWQTAHGNDADLDFGWLKEHFPGFPATMLADRVKDTYNVLWGEMFGKLFWQQAWVMAFLEQVDKKELSLETEWAAMVFTVPHAHQANLMVIHTPPYLRGDASYEPSDTTRVLRTIPGTSITLAIEPLQSFVVSTGKSWIVVHD